MFLLLSLSLDSVRPKPQKGSFLLARGVCGLPDPAQGVNMAGVTAYLSYTMKVAMRMIKRGK